MSSIQFSDCIFNLTQQYKKTDFYHLYRNLNLKLFWFRECFKYILHVISPGQFGLQHRGSLFRDNLPWIIKNVDKSSNNAMISGLYLFHSVLNNLNLQFLAISFVWWSKFCMYILSASGFLRSSWRIIQVQRDNSCLELDRTDGTRFHHATQNGIQLKLINCLFPEFPI